MKAALYIRVSTVYQIDKDSLPMQRQDLINYAKIILGIDEYEIFEDAGYSAKNTDRPAFQNMMNKIRKREFTHILVWKLDRISRNLSDFTNMWEEFNKYGVQFISKNEQFDTSTAMGSAMLKIILVFAELERKMTGERVKATMISRAEEGKWNGANVPIGYKFDNKIMFPVPDEDEAPLVQLIFDQYEAIRSTNKLSVWLNENKYKTKRGGVWSGNTVGQILKNPFYIGTLRYNYRAASRGQIKPEDEWVVIENNHQGIISKEQWERVNAILAQNSIIDTRRIMKKHVHIFSGLIKCYKCGGNFSASTDRARNNGYTPSKYACSNKGRGKNCDLKGYASDMLVGEFILNYMSNMLFLQKNFDEENMESILLRGKAFKNIAYVHPDSLHDLKNVIGNKSSNKIDRKPIQNNINNRALLQKKQKLERALKRLDDLFLFSDDAMSEQEYLSKKTPIINEINTIEMQLNIPNDKPTDLLLNNRQLSQCVLDWKLGSGEYIEFKKLAFGIDTVVLKEFMNNVLNKITMGENRQIIEIEFKNGLVQKFLYR